MGENIRTYEELLIERINKTLTALDNENREQFDRVMENTEILLKVKGGLYDIYIKWKNHYGKLLMLAYEQIEKQVASIDDPYSKDMLRKQKEGVAEWGYRLDILQKLISLLNDYNLVPFGTPEYAEIQTEIPPEEQSEQEITSEPEQPQKTQQELLAEDMERLKKEEQEIMQQQKQPQHKIRFKK